MTATPPARRRLRRAERARRRTRRAARVARVARRVPGRGARRGGGRGIRHPAARRRPARPRLRHDRSRRLARPRPGAAPRARDPAATRCTTRSRMSRASCIPTARSTSRPAGAGRRCTPPTAASRCIRRCSARTGPRCCPASTAAPTSGRSTSTRPARCVRTRLERASCARATGSATTRRRPASTRARPTGRSSSCCVRSVALRIEQERARGGASLNAPDEEIVRTPDGGYALERRRLLPVEDWNAQLSLMTGMAAAELMIEARVGILRTMPQPDRPTRIAAFRTQTEALGRPWHRLDRVRRVPARPRSRRPRLARDHAGRGRAVPRRRLRGDGRRACRPTPCSRRSPRRTRTSPRRCGASSTAGASSSARRSAPAATCRGGHATRSRELPSLMGASSQRASQLEAASVARVEAAVLSDRVGERFAATVLEVRGRLAPSSSSWNRPSPPPVPSAPTCSRGRVAVVLEHADIRAGTVRFSAD